MNGTGRSSFLEEGPSGGIGKPFIYIPTNSNEFGGNLASSTPLHSSASLLTSSEIDMIRMKVSKFPTVSVSFFSCCQLCVCLNLFLRLNICKRKIH